MSKASKKKSGQKATQQGKGVSAPAASMEGLDPLPKASPGDTAPSKKKAKGKVGQPGSKDPSRRCTATANRTGERCGAPAIKGGTVCRMHGGALPQVKKKAKERLLELVDPALAVLHKILTDPNTEDAVKVRAALGTLDRTGFGPGQTITFQTTEWDEMFKEGDLILDRSLGGGDKPIAELETVAAAGEQLSYDATQENFREQDDEEADRVERGRIRPTANTIKGEVIPTPKTKGEPDRWQRDRNASTGPMSFGDQTNNRPRGTSEMDPSDPNVPHKTRTEQVQDRLHEQDGENR